MTKEYVIHLDMDEAAMYERAVSNLLETYRINIGKIESRVGMKPSYKVNFEFIYNVEMLLKAVTGHDVNLTD